MASYPVHLGTASVVGALYGSAAIWVWNRDDWGPVFLAAGLTTLGGVLPDLDSDSGIPIRELFSIAAAVAPLLLLNRLRAAFTPEQALVLVGGLYVFIRYGVAALFKRFTVHRGVFHSIPAMFIAGLCVYLLYESPDRDTRIFLAVGTMLGFLSHLVLDEMYSVDLMGIRIRLNKYAGSALKLYSPSWKATAACYVVLFALAFLCFLEADPPVHVAELARIQPQP